MPNTIAFALSWRDGKRHGSRSHGRSAKAPPDEAATDMFSLPPPRHIPTPPFATFPSRGSYVRSTAIVPLRVSPKLRQLLPKRCANLIQAVLVRLGRRTRLRVQHVIAAGFHTFPQMLFEGRYPAAHRRIVDRLRGPRIHGPECKKTLTSYSLPDGRVPCAGRICEAHWNGYCSQDARQCGSRLIAHGPPRCRLSCPRNAHRRPRVAQSATHTSSRVRPAAPSRLVGRHSAVPVCAC
jgi:hypothetical protein